MIIYRDRRPGRSEPPPWLADAIDLNSREDVEGRLWCAGDALRLASAPDRAWLPLADDWQVRMTKEGPEPERLAKVLPWAASMEVNDGAGRRWQAPRILASEGHRLFRVRYTGANWTPVLTEEQQFAETAATSARDAFLALAEARKAGIAGVSPPREATCAWAALLLCVWHPLSVEVVSTLGLLDDLLVVDVLKVASGTVEPDA